MAKVMKCSEVGFDCGFVAHGNSEEEILAQNVEHAHKDHGMTTISPEVAAKVKAAIHEV
jgi:predicted small metal-binding protein